MTTDIKISNKIPDSAVNENNTDYIKDSENNTINVIFKDKNGYTVMIQPIRVDDVNSVAQVSYNKSFNVITVKFNNGNETNVSVGRHLLLTNGDLELTKGIDCVVQQIDVGLHLLKGDWVLDSTAGIDYFGGMRAYPEILNAQIKKAINTVENVDTVLKYKFIENDDNVYNVSATVKVGNTEIPINQNVIPTQKG